MNKHINPCSSSIASKCYKLVFDSSQNRQTQPLSLIHSDVWGPTPILSCQGFKFYVLFVDDFSRYSWVFPIQHKSDVFQIFVNFRTQIERFTSQNIKILRTDGGSEYLNSTFKNYLTKHGITHQISCPYTLEQNGLAERKHRHIIETTHPLLHTASLPHIYWPDVVNTSVFLKTCYLPLA